MSWNQDSYKGIALLTPGGDVIYGLDVDKGKRWHLDLCEGLQELLGLEESPHFLIPAYTATVDQSVDPNSGRKRVMSEVYPLVQRHRPLLSAIFGVDPGSWTVLPWEESYGDPKIIEAYQDQFPQLWENHDLVVNLASLRYREQPMDYSVSSNRGYVLRLFISGHSQATRETLTTLHRLLEQKLSDSYTLKVVDIMKHPEQAEANHISATPTLVRLHPEPMRRIVGKWDDLDYVLQLIESP